MNSEIIFKALVLATTNKHDQLLTLTESYKPNRQFWKEDKDTIKVKDI